MKKTHETAKRILAIGAHADDVELHFGGTLFKYRDRGYEIVYVMSTNNMSGGPREQQPDGSWKKLRDYDPIVTMEYRKRETAEAARLFGTEPIHLDHPQRKCHVADASGQMIPVEVGYGRALPPGVPEYVPSILTAFADRSSVDQVKNLILEKNPEVIFTHGYAEVNPEHHATFLLVMRAYGKAVEDGYTGSLLAGARSFNELGRFACLWETWVDITDYVDKRYEAVLKHASQYPAGFTHGADHWRELAERKGQFCGVQAVEAFNFVNETHHASEKTEVLNELLHHRAVTAPWGFSGNGKKMAADS